ncbi:hypothetical protein A4A49_37674 [Nicotiana attenuata]|uniref:Uncharacterized protein n=1 Tax=Nicotiana attenuata TaxID=49451 RepID=A0A1J6KP75_NICAT|nr:hypothetical protein A4A49_37674 [Nicotiana attenuata]
MQSGRDLISLRSTIDFVFFFLSKIWILTLCLFSIGVNSSKRSSEEIRQKRFLDQIFLELQTLTILRRLTDLRVQLYRRRHFIFEFLRFFKVCVLFSFEKFSSFYFSGNEILIFDVTV